MKVTIMVCTKNDFNNFPKKCFLGEIGHFDQKMAHPHNSGSAQNFFKILQNEIGTWKFY